MDAHDGDGEDFGRERNSDMPPADPHQDVETQEPEIDLGGFNMDDIIKANNRNLGRYDNVGFGN